MVFVSHMHLDHVLDLAALIQALYWTPGFTREKSLTLIGPTGFRVFFELYVKPLAQLPKPDVVTFAIRVVEIEEPLSCAGFAVTCVQTVHDTETASVAYKFTEAGKSLVVSGDCAYDQNLIDFCKQSDLLPLDCTFAGDTESTRHLNATQCGQIAYNASAKKLILTHLHPTSSEQLRLKQARKIFKNTVLGADLMRCEIQAHKCCFPVT